MAIVLRLIMFRVAVVLIFTPESCVKLDHVTVTLVFMGSVSILLRSLESLDRILVNVMRDIVGNTVRQQIQQVPQQQPRLHPQVQRPQLRRLLHLLQLAQRLQQQPLRQLQPRQLQPQRQQLRQQQVQPPQLRLLQPLRQQVQPQQVRQLQPPPQPLQPQQLQQLRRQPPQLLRQLQHRMLVPQFLAMVGNVLWTGLDMIVYVILACKVCRFATN